MRDRRSPATVTATFKAQSPLVTRQGRRFEGTDAEARKPAVTQSIFDRKRRGSLEGGSRLWPVGEDAMKRIFFFMAAILLVEATGLHAQEQSGTEQNPINLKDSIAVTANRTPTPLSEIASSITVITREEIEKSQSALVAHLLRNVPGLDVVQSGGTGKFTSVFIRGANTHHTLVLLDGVPLNDPSSPNNASDLSTLMTANIDRIEILRGPQSVLYGPEAIGGVVQIFTQAGEKENNVSISSAAGSFDTYNLAGNISGKLEKLGYSLSAERFKTHGISSADKTFGGTENDGYENTSLSSRFDYNVSQTFRLNLAGRFTDSKSDLDKTSTPLDDPNYISSQKEQQYSLRLNRQTLNSKSNQQILLYLGDIDRNTSDDYDPAHASDSEFTETTGKRIGASYQQTFEISRFNSLSAGIETERASFSSDLFFRSMFGDFTDHIGGKRSWTRGLFIFDQMQFKEQLFLTLGGRLDEHKQFGTTGTYRLTAAYLLNRTNTRFRGVIGTGYKAPSVFQLYHPSPYIGNPNLLPEKSRSWEVGVEQEFKRNFLSASLTYFDNYFKDLIVGIQNVAEAYSRGIEAAIEVKNNKLRSRFDYTYCNSKDRSTEEILIRRPEHKLVLATEYKFTDKLLLNLTARYTGEREDLDFSQFPAPRVRLKEYTVVNFAASFAFSKNLELTGRVDNMVDEDYQEVYSYGSVPLSVYAGIRISN